MNREETEKAIEVMQAHLDGKIINVRYSGEPEIIATILSSEKPVWNWKKFDYFVKPEPIERWIAVWGESKPFFDDHHYCYHSKAACIQMCSGSTEFVKAIKLVEAE